MTNEINILASEIREAAASLKLGRTGTKKQKDFARELVERLIASGWGNARLRGNLEGVSAADWVKQYVQKANAACIINDLKTSYATNWIYRDIESCLANFAKKAQASAV